MNPHIAAPLSPRSLISSIYHNWQLILQMTKREVIGRYRGSIMGLLWSFLNPVFMLAVYTFVFSVVFKARWGGGESETRSEFAIILFAGIIVHSLLAEVLNRAPGLILGNSNYVTKVVFPLEILPIIALGASLFHCTISVLVLLTAQLALTHEITWTALLLPLVLLPLAILTLGIAWVLSSLGVYIRDVGQTIGIITTVMLFLSPVFFPVSALPENLQPLMMLNPLTFIIEQSREVLIWGHLPDWYGLAFYTLASTVISWIGYVWFQMTRRGFADVL